MTLATTTDFSSALTAAIHGGYIAQLTDQTYTIRNPIVIHVTSTTQGPLGIDGGGATLVSEVTNGEPLIQIVVGPGVDLRYLTFSNLAIQGTGLEGAGIQVIAAGNDRWVYNWNISDVTVQNVGGYGLDMQGSVFEGLVANSWMIENVKGGAYFGHHDGGQASALRWFGGGFQNNGGAGLTLGGDARDMSVDGALFSENGGAGISAQQGITSVTSSTFVDNEGPGIWFQNYGNFRSDTFVSQGSQTVGIKGWLSGAATLSDSISTGSSLANLQGFGSVLISDTAGTIVTGTHVAVDGAGGETMTSLSFGGQGIARPALSPITAATTEAIDDSHGTGPLELALKGAIAGGSVTYLSDSIYVVTAPIVINITHSTQAATGIDLGGAKIFSAITDGRPVIELMVDPGVDIENLSLSNFMIQGNGREGDGLKIIADGTDRSINLNLTNVYIEHVGGIGLDVIGNVHGSIFNAWMHGNAAGGARFANSAGGGIACDLDWIAGGFRKNGVAGLILDNGTRDLAVKGAYFVENTGPGLYATAGIRLVEQSGFENNLGVAAIVDGTSAFVDNSFSTGGSQITGVAGVLSDGEWITMTGNGAEYYGPGADPSILANIQGSGTLAIAGIGNVIAGPDISLARPGTLPISPDVTVKLDSDTGVSSTDLATCNPTLIGTAEPNSTVTFTVDGVPLSTNALSDASGAWSFIPTGLTQGSHTIVVSETASDGLLGSSALTFTLDTKVPVPVITGAYFADGQVTLRGHCEAFSTLSIYDGDTWLGFATTATDGAWSITRPADADAPHAFGAIATDLVGNEAKISNYDPAKINPMAPAMTLQLASDRTGSAIDQLTSNGALRGTADPHATVRFEIDGIPLSATAHADGVGAWSFAPIGLPDGHHFVFASTTNAYGLTGSVSFSFTLDSTASMPHFHTLAQSENTVSLTGSTGGTAGETVWLYDGDVWLGAAETRNGGVFEFTVTAEVGTVHSYGAIATDLAGNVGKTQAKTILGSSHSEFLLGGAGADLLVGGGDSDTLIGGEGADMLDGGAGADRFVYGAVRDLGDLIQSFEAGAEAGSVDKLDFDQLFDTLAVATAARAERFNFMQTGTTASIAIDLDADGNFETTIANLIDIVGALDLGDFLLGSL